MLTLYQPGVRMLFTVLPRPPRIALYSHDAQGLGHIRRNLAIARALAQTDPAPDMLVLTGAPEAPGMPRPAHCDVITLPTVAKSSRGRYSARELSGGLDDVVFLRSSVITSALVAFAPDLLVVDKLPRGFGGELEPALDLLTSRDVSDHGPTRVVLGLRDVLDEPGRVRRDWDAQRASDAIDQWYDQIWVYSDPEVHNPVAACDLPAALAPLTRFTGYLGWGRVGLEQAADDGAPAAPDPPYVLGIVGGGQDGAALARTVATSPLPAGHRGLLVTGPHMPKAQAREVAAIALRSPGLTVAPFVSPLEPTLLDAAAVVTMGGYNSVCEVLTTDVPALVVPRTRPRREQLIRARRMAELGLLDTMGPDRLTPGRLGDWLARAVAGPRRPRRHVDLHGLARIRDLAATLLAGDRSPAPTIPAQAPARVAG